MLSYLFTVLNQFFIFSALMVLGYFLYQKKILTHTGSKEISTLLMKVITPFVVVIAFNQDYDPALTINLIEASILSVIAYLIPILISFFAFRRDAQRINKTLCLTFSNNGFMAIPLLQALLGDIGVVLGTPHIVLGNILLWTFAARLINGENYKLDLRQIFLNPGSLGLILGLAVFFSPVELPAPIWKTADYLAGLTTPLAMILLGVYVARTEILSCLRDVGMHLLLFVKLLVIPFLLLGLFYLLPLDKSLCTAVLIGSVAPCGMVSPQILEQFNRDNGYCTRAVAYSTLWSILTIPLVLVVANAIL